jgi:siroheme synthase (precorrin-2 oxidase/ferrochelatase)
MRGLIHLRHILQNFNVLVLSEQFVLPHAHEAFAIDGAIKDAKYSAAISALAQRLVSVTAKMKS